MRPFLSWLLNKFDKSRKINTCPFCGSHVVCFYDNGYVIRCPKGCIVISLYARNVDFDFLVERWNYFSKTSYLSLFKKSLTGGKA